MFKYLRGTVAKVEPNMVIMDVGGVGFGCNTSLITSSSVKAGEVATIYTYLHVREDILDLYGFCDEDELMCFKLLTSISGVGPKAALAILSVVTPSALTLAVATGDEKPLVAASGVGKKLAGRIILELKDKLAKSAIELSDMSGGTVASVSASSDNEAVAALGALGYGRDEINSALRGVDTSSMNVEDIIKLALARLMR